MSLFHRSAESIEGQAPDSGSSSTDYTEMLNEARAEDGGSNPVEAAISRAVSMDKGRVGTGELAIDNGVRLWGSDERQPTFDDGLTSTLKSAVDARMANGVKELEDGDKDFEARAIREKISRDLGIDGTKPWKGQAFKEPAISSIDLGKDTALVVRRFSPDRDSHGPVQYEASVVSTVDQADRKAA